MVKSLFIGILLGLVANSYAQNDIPSFPDFIGKSFGDIQENPAWTILNKASGDLNKDGQEDIAIVLESRDSIIEKRCSSCKRLKNKPRIILVFFEQSKRLIATIQNNEFIARGDEGGMTPYIKPELSITEGLLNIFYQYTRSNLTYTFKYVDGEMLIVAAQFTGVQAASGDYEKSKYDFIAKKITSETGNISDIKFKKATIQIMVEAKALSQFETMMDWKVAENHYL